jgi:hypothetical protein
MRLIILSSFLLFLSACSSFGGIRTPRYDGQPIEADPVKIEAFQTSNEIIGEEKEFYLPESISEEIRAESLSYIEHDPILLGEGTYVIGEDLPAGRVSLNGQKENPQIVFPSDEYIPGAPMEETGNKVGTLYIRDEAGDLYFENMFHSLYGVLITQVDFIEGHTIEIIGEQADVVVFYADEIPEDPYIFDTRQEEFDAQFEDLEEGEFVESYSEVEIMPFEQEQPVNILDNGEIIHLKAGIYEVGEHFAPGLYEMSNGWVPTHSAAYLFREGEEVRVFEVADILYSRPWAIEEPEPVEHPPTIDLQTGDKFYLSYIDNLTLTKVEE